MDARELKEITNEAEQTASRIWHRQDDPARQQFLQRAEQYRDARATLKQLKTDKQQCARKFRGADDTLQKALREEMRHISADISETESQLKSVGEEIGAILTRIDEACTNSSPDSFAHWQHGTAVDAPATLRICASDHVDERWNRYVADHPGGHFYLRSDVVSDIAALGNHKHHFFYAHRDDGSLCGVLPLVEMRSRLFGHFAVNLPYVNYGGALGDSPDIEAALITRASHLLDNGCAHIELRDTRQRPNLPARTDKVSMLLQLPGDRETLFESFPSKVRAQIRRPQRENLDYRHGGIELLGDFYQVFAEHMRDLGTPVYPRHLFALLLQHYAENCSLHLLYQQQRPVAAAFLLRDGNTMQIPWAATLRRVHDISANMLLYWEVLGHAIAENCDWFDFGRSTRDAGTYRFKRQWGAQPVDHYWHYVLREGEALPAINPDNPKYRVLIAVWKRLPVWLTKLIGPRIVMSIP